MTYSILIVEDEKRAAKRIERLTSTLLETDDVKFFSATDIEKALIIIRDHELDLMYLDLNLHGESGFNILKQVVSYNFHVIVVSAYTEKALEAFEFGVLDFVPKPVLPARLEIALKRFQEQTVEHNSNRTKYLTIKERGTLFTVETDAILFIRAEGHYAEVITRQGGSYFHDKSLEKLMMILPDNFYRIHKSYILNKHYLVKIKSYPGSKYEATLSGDTSLPIGRKFYKELKKEFVGK